MEAVHIKGHRFELKQDGMVVAIVEGQDRARALKEIMHYAMMYAEDGKVTVDGVSAEDWESLNPTAPETEPPSDR